MLTLFGRFIAVKLTQFSNELLLIFITPFDIFISSILIQFLKSLFSTVFIDGLIFPNNIDSFSKLVKIAG